ncbi:MAG: hypothetical protein VCB42_06435, partial [Myxococcota bacterium]
LDTTARGLEASSESPDVAGEPSESEALAGSPRGRRPAGELSLALDRQAFAAGHEFVPDRESFAAGPPLLEIADPKEQAAVAMESMLDVAVGGALASECAIALRVDDEDGEALELELGDPLQPNGHEDSLEAGRVQGLPALDLDARAPEPDEFFEFAPLEDVEAQAELDRESEEPPLLLSDEELAGAELGAGRGESMPRD